MFKFFFRFFILFLAITGAVALLAPSTQTLEFGQVNYWNVRGLFFLFFISIFPRLTLLFSSVAFGGLFWWIGFIFAPRILVAFLATLAYWNTNPILVTISWIFALSAEPFEKSFLKKSFIIRTVKTRTAPPQGYTVSPDPFDHNRKNKTIIDVKSEVR